MASGGGGWGGSGGGGGGNIRSAGGAEMIKAEKIRRPRLSSGDGSCSRAVCQTESGAN